MVEKNQKRTYVKPQLQVVEWNFNEEVCADNFSKCTNCFDVEDSGSKQMRLNIFNEDVTWHTFDESSNSRRGF